VYAALGDININIGSRPDAGTRPVDARAVAGDIPQTPPGFQPREHLLAQLRAAGPGASVVRAVTGMHGVGKTQLAAAYARECIDARWRLVAWLSAEDASDVQAGMGLIADRLDIATGNGAEADAARVRDWLAADGERCLVVFDDVTDVSAVRRYLPAAGGAQVVVTSTSQAAASLGTRVDVDVFTEEEALSFLRVRTGRDDPGGARRLATELGSLPLALGQAAAVIRGQTLSCDEYLERLRSFSLGDYLAPPDGEPYPRGVAQAILLSVDVVTGADQSGLCGRLLGLIAVLSPAGVRRELLYAAGQADMLSAAEKPRLLRRRRKRSEPVTAHQVDVALERLAAASLLGFSTAEGVTLAAHRTVMRVVRERHAHDRTLADIGERACALLSFFDEELVDSIDESTKLRDIAAPVRDFIRQASALNMHLRAHTSTGDPLSDALTGVLWRVLRYLEEIGDPDPRVTIDSELGISIRLDGGDSPPRGRGNGEQLAYSVALLERVLADRVQALGDSHLDTLMSRYSLAVAYREQGRTDEAVTQFGRALAGLEATHWAKHPDLNLVRHELEQTKGGAQMIAVLKAKIDEASRNAELGASRLAEDHPAEAIEPLKQALEFFEPFLGADAQGTQATRSNLATAYARTGRPAEAVDLLEAVLADTERSLGGDHPDTLRVRANLAGAYLDVGRLAEAVPLLERGVADAERRLGTNHLDILEARKNLAEVCTRAGLPKKAVVLQKQLVAGAERVLGADHPNTLTARNNLAAAYLDAGRPAEAAALLERCLADAERLLGADHQATQRVRANLAAVSDRARRLAEIAAMEQTFADDDRLLGADHQATLMSRGDLANAYLQAGRPADAIALLERGVSDTERLLGAGHRHTLKARTDLANAYLEAGHGPEGIALLKRLLADMERFLGSDHGATQTVREWLASRTET
jgi:tetratricopeptide (TPR) repeat protein